MTWLLETKSPPSCYLRLQGRTWGGIYSFILCVFMWFFFSMIHLPNYIFLHQG